MSLGVLQAVYEQPEPGDGVARAVLVFLAWKTCAKRGVAWPSIGSISKATGFSRATVKRQLKELEQTGNIERAYGGNGRTVHWKVIGGKPGSERAPIARARVRGSERTRAHSDTGLTQSTTGLTQYPNQAHSDTKPGSERAPINNKTLKKESAQASPSPTPAGPATAKPAFDVAAWVQEAKAAIK